MPSGLTDMTEEGRERRSVVIIREIYDSENANEIFEQQLEQALAKSVDTIIIEPYKLGDETTRWIAVGNCLHKTAVLAGFGSILSAFVWPDKAFIFVPATMLSSLCTGLYSLSWQSDPCVKYQVENSGRQLQQLSLGSFNSASPVVLVRRDDTRRKILHTAVTLACLGQTVLRFYFPYMNLWFGRASFRGFSNQVSPPISSNRLIVSELGVPQPTPVSNNTSFMSNAFGGGLKLL